MARSAVAGSSALQPAGCVVCGALVGPEGNKLRPCSGRRVLCYCRETCQAQHWKHGGHWQACAQQAAAPVQAANKKVEGEVKVQAQAAIAGQEGMAQAAAAAAMPC